MREFKSTPKWRSAIILFGVCTLIGLLFAALSYASVIGENRRFGLSDALRLNLVQFYLWGGLSLPIFCFSNRFPVEFRPFRLRNLLLHIPAILLFAIIHQGIYLTILWSLTPRLKQQFASIAQYYRTYFGIGVYGGLIIASLIVIAAHAFIYYQDFRAGEVKQSELKTQLAQARLQALKMQLHPHFLFNTLHSISSLVLEDPPRANSMIARLGDFLRLTLEHSEEQMVMLKEELEFLRCYLEIEQVRFEDRLSVDFRIEPTTLSAHVPHLILQPVVENAIQHAIAPRATPGCIKIEAKRLDGLLRLEVKDNGPGIKTKSNSVERQGLGLSNVRARLKQIYGTEFRFEMANAPEGGLTVVLEMPFQFGIPDDLFARGQVV
jgi:two-component system LytT family sensor kinase